MTPCQLPGKNAYQPAIWKVVAEGCHWEKLVTRKLVRPKNLVVIALVARQVASVSLWFVWEVSVYLTKQ